MTDTSPLLKNELLSYIQTSWDDLTAYLDALTPTQLTTLTDAGGWTVKDHIIHLAVWESGAVALLQRQSRLHQMGIDEAMWKRWNFDEINAVIQRRYQDMPLDEVLKTFHETHRQMMAIVEAMSDEDLQEPAYDVDQQSTGDIPVSHQITLDTYGHFEEHKPWIIAIVDQDTLLKSAESGN